MILFSILKMVYCDHENSQHIFLLFKKIAKISILCLLALGYDIRLLARTYIHGSKSVRAIEVLLYIKVKP